MTIYALCRKIDCVENLRVFGVNIWTDISVRVKKNDITNVWQVVQQVKINISFRSQDDLVEPGDFVKIASFPENTFYLLNFHKCKCYWTAQSESQNFSQATFHKSAIPDLDTQSDLWLHFKKKTFK